MLRRSASEPPPPAPELDPRRGRFADLPGWAGRRPAARRWRRSGAAAAGWAKQAADKTRRRPARSRRHGRGLAARSAPRSGTPAAADGRARFFEASFLPVRGRATAASAEGLFTGYYEPLLHGCARSATRATATRSTGARADLVSVDLGQFDPELAGPPRSPAGSRRASSCPTPIARAIDRGALAGRELELLWVDDPVDRFFLEIQGSGQIRLPTARSCGSATPTRTAGPTARSART